MGESGQVRMCHFQVADKQFEELNMLFTAVFLQNCILANLQLRKSSLQKIRVPARLHSIGMRLFSPQIILDLVPYPYQIHRHAQAHVQSKSLPLSCFAEYGVHGIYDVCVFGSQ